MSDCMGHQIAWQKVLIDTLLSGWCVILDTDLLTKKMNPQFLSKYLRNRSIEIIGVEQV